ncbi:hypothetical protein [Candidatus Poriferisodalis sp.]|uniref:hypothetical protein n=1 Tax=Candidatus Poriferisodalis sp. TaxID=3101277 RepID=UPI003B521626
MSEAEREGADALVDAIDDALSRLSETDMEGSWPLQGHIAYGEAQAVRELWDNTPEWGQRVVIATACLAIVAGARGRLSNQIRTRCLQALGISTGTPAVPLAPEPDNDDDDGCGSGDGGSSDDSDTSTGTYCSAWSGFRFFKAKGEEIGEVVLHENGGGSTSYQGTQEWATASCQAALAAQGQ